MNRSLPTISYRVLFAVVSALKLSNLESTHAVNKAWKLRARSPAASAAALS